MQLICVAALALVAGIVIGLALAAEMVSRVASRGPTPLIALKPWRPRVMTPAELHERYPLRDRAN
jgi:hypothetical protein